MLSGMYSAPVLGATGAAAGGVPCRARCEMDVDASAAMAHAANELERSATASHTKVR